MIEPSETEIILIYIIGTFAMLFIAGAIFFFFITYQKRMLKKELEINRIKASRQDEILKNTVQAQEKERKRIAQDLHDQVGAMLSVVKLNVARIEKKSVDESSQNLAGETKSYLDELISEVRRISRALMPPSLEKLGFSFALKELASWVNKSNQVKVSYTDFGQPFRLPVKKELAIFRIVQELVTNALKHSQARNIEVRTRFSDKYVVVWVADDGTGFDIHGLESTGLGLKNLESRSKLIGARFKMKSFPQRGTFAIIVLKMND